ncbi:conserved hypothetical protein [Trichormus variabilis ATCC 29413]|uniref:DUF2854 domain-containing protein n=2 Tax=Anabaena variabilis TaxID=264691 RepID=Q3M8B0_TRIV2|nr:MULTISPECIES: DUF2854 domain-containing protein [Nostocaceae]ABA22776.1 conserved hypothetical protein [Trichormus variabilis ATCC 29413]MBC1216097.1 DUF2854 domain-containing protein [Trichormus variabilis ARAD]MBC1255845.1 DUF2854 domain-containing protein [Trichormus variabilis V5]MBC1268787.1 DUF2854 domain-containing protein [Trichormus variabilis FSR]MBC1304177.1 DUF2854 domain-containing protein [Trichormus variabilis N2B]
MLRQISLGTIGLSIGGILTIVGFVAYAANNATLNLVGFFYGFPLLLGGLALKANELKPISFSQTTTESVLLLRQQQATVTQNKIRKDITRYCYGQNAHLDGALSYLGLSPSDEDRPIVTGLRETETNGAYTLILEFDSPEIPVSDWQQKQEKMTKYFGPGVEIKITQVGEDKIELALITLSQEPIAQSNRQ